MIYACLCVFAQKAVPYLILSFPEAIIPFDFQLIMHILSKHTDSHLQNMSLNNCGCGNKR